MCFTLRLIVCLCVDIDTNDDIETTDNRDNHLKMQNGSIIDDHIVIINPCDFQIGTVAKLLPE